MNRPGTCGCPAEPDAGGDPEPLAIVFEALEAGNIERVETPHQLIDFSVITTPNLSIAASMLAGALDDNWWGVPHQQSEAQIFVDNELVGSILLLNEAFAAPVESTALFTMVNPAAAVEVWLSLLGGESDEGNEAPEHRMTMTSAVLVCSGAP